MTQFGVVIDGYSNTNVKAFEEATGATVDTVLGYGSGESWDAMPPGWLYDGQFLGGTGKPANLSLPMAPDSAGVAEYAEIASGARNGHYKAWAQEILGGQPGDGPIYIRSTWEVGGEWFPWTAVARENPEVFKAAWQQFARSFHEVSDRFQTVWDFNSDRGEVESMYPGDEAVDVIGQDIYWNPEYQGFDPSGAFEHLVSGYSRGLGWMDEFAAKHGKPMAISEWAVATSELPDAAAAAWIDEFTAWVVEQNTEGDGPGVAYMNYWNTSEAWAHGGRIEDAGPLVQDALMRMAAAIRGDGWTPAPKPAPVESEPQEPSGGEEPELVPAPSPGPGGASVSLEAGEGPDALVLKISQDAYKGAAEYVVTVDGRQVGGVFTASAAHGSGQSDTLTLRGDWGAGEHEFAVEFLNDLYEAPWDAAHDRNLHLEGATFNGVAVEGAAASLFSAEAHDFVLGG